MAVKNQKFAADGRPELQWSMPTVCSSNLNAIHTGTEKVAFRNVINFGGQKS